MSQRNPMNDRYTGEGPKGTTRKSAASAKPKSKAAATVIVKSNKKTEKEKKAERKAERRRAAAEQRELDRKYYKPDTKRYRNLRILWGASLAVAILCAVMMFLTRDASGWANIICIVLAYGFIIVAFYIDFGLIRKERRQYQERMVALEEKQQRKAKYAKGRNGASADAETQKATPKKVSGKNATRNPKKQAEAARRNAEAAEAAEADAQAEQAKESKPKGLGRFFGSKAQAATPADGDTAASDEEAKSA